MLTPSHFLKDKLHPEISKHGCDFGFSKVRVPNPTQTFTDILSKQSQINLKADCGKCFDRWNKQNKSLTLIDSAFEALSSTCMIMDCEEICINKCYRKPSNPSKSKGKVDYECLSNCVNNDCIKVSDDTGYRGKLVPYDQFTTATQLNAFGIPGIDISNIITEPNSFGPTSVDGTGLTLKENEKKTNNYTFSDD